MSDYLRQNKWKDISVRKKCNFVCKRINDNSQIQEITLTAIRCYATHTLHIRICASFILPQVIGHFNSTNQKKTSILYIRGINPLPQQRSKQNSFSDKSDCVWFLIFRFSPFVFTQITPLISQFFWNTPKQWQFYTEPRRGRKHFSVRMTH